MDFDDLTDVRLDRDPDDFLPEGWDDVADEEIEVASIRRRMMADAEL